MDLAGECRYASARAPAEALAFVGIAYCQRLGGHIHMDLVIGQFRGRVLYALEWIGTLFILLLALVLIWGSWRHFVRSFDFAAPLWSLKEQRGTN